MVTLANPSVRQIDRYVNDYDTALKFLGHRYERKLANNTIVRRDSQYTPGKSGSRLVSEGATETLPNIQIVLHRTPIVTYYPDGRVMLNSGGYHTVTTKQRMNQLLPPGFGVEQKNYDWYVHAPDGSREDFFDGIILKGPLSEAAREKLTSLSRQMTTPKYPGHQPNPSSHDKDGLVGYIDVAREGEELRDWQGKVMGWRVLHNLRTYRNAQGDRSYGVLLINAHRSSRSRYAGGLLLVDGGSLFRGRKFPGVGGDEARQEAISEAEYWAQIDAEAPDEEGEDEE